MLLPVACACLRCTLPALSGSAAAVPAGAARPQRAAQVAATKMATSYAAPETIEGPKSSSNTYV